MRTKLFVPIVAVLCIALWVGLGGRQYPEATSPESLVLIKALYTACSSESMERLTRVERQVAESMGAGALSEAEQQAFASIIDHAKAGEWPLARTESYRFAQDQLR